MPASMLRSPVFPGADAVVSHRTADDAGPATDPDAIEPVFTAIRSARVGGSFWSPPSPKRGAATLVRARSIDDIERTLAWAEGSALWMLSAELAQRATVTARLGTAPIVTGEVDPWSLLDGSVLLVAHGDDEWVALAVIAGCAVRVLSQGRFGAPGDDAATLRHRAAQDLADTAYRNPYTGEPAGLDATIELLAAWRCLFEANDGLVAACGFSWWKRREMARFLWTPTRPLRFFRSERRAITHAARAGGAVAIWPSRVSGTMAAAAAMRGVPLVRVEDGFVRSVGLGSNLVPPSSVAVDRRGIHYDPARPSDLEVLLASPSFSPALLSRAERLRMTIVTAGISKYGGDSAHPFPPRALHKVLVLVPGQVEDDQSVLLGGAGATGNLDLLRRVRALEPEAEIWFRPHPDVDAGHRKGAVRDSEALRHADRIVRGGAMARLLDMVDAVHVLTSLAGFEALLRGRAVTCHGVPFYAGWGLTRDLAPVPDRRGRCLTMSELVAAVLILYPRYLDPVTGLPCPPEVLIARMATGGAHNRLSWITRLKQVQGRLTKGWV